MWGMALSRCGGVWGLIFRCLDLNEEKHRHFNLHFQGTPEANVGLFCELARQSGALYKQHGVCVS